MKIFDKRTNEITQIPRVSRKRVILSSLLTEIEGKQQWSCEGNHFEIHTGSSEFIVREIFFYFFRKHNATVEMEF